MQPVRHCSEELRFSPIPVPDVGTEAWTGGVTCLGSRAVGRGAGTGTRAVGAWGLCSSHSPFTADAHRGIGELCRVQNIWPGLSGSVSCRPPCGHVTLPLESLKNKTQTHTTYPLRAVPGSRGGLGGAAEPHSPGQARLGGELMPSASHCPSLGSGSKQRGGLQTRGLGVGVRV